MRFALNVLAALVAIFLPYLPAPVSAQSSDAYRYVTIWASPAPSWSTPSYGASPEVACRSAYNIGSQCIYYKGTYFVGLEGPSNPAEPIGTLMQCVSDIGISCPGIGVPPPFTWDVRLVCAKENKATGARTINSYGRCPPQPKRCGDETGENPTVGNPCELPRLAKVVHDIDWASPTEPRFVIDRFYRSDEVLVRLFESSLTSTRDSLAGVWQFGFQDWLVNFVKNANSPSDTRSFFQFRAASGMSSMYLISNPSVTLGFTGLTFTKNDYTYYYLTDGQGLVYKFEQFFGGGAYPLFSKTWPDGYKITMTRTGSPGLQISRMADNRGNIADFVYDNNVTPGANRPLVKEITLSRTDGTTTTSFGKSVYTYEVLTYNFWISPSQQTRRPVVTAVDYVDLSTSVTVPRRIYTYSTGGGLEFAYPPLLTSISDGTRDGSGDPVPFAEYSYKYYGTPSQTSRIEFGLETSRRNGDTVPTTYELQGGGVVEATNPYGLLQTYTFAPMDQGGDIPLKLETDETAASGTVLPTERQYSYDPTGPVSAIVERNGSRTTFTRDSRGRVLTRTEDADGPAPRVTTYTWPSVLRLPLTRVTDGLTETSGYDGNGLLLTYSQTDTRTGSSTLGQVRPWTYGYTTLASGLKVLGSVDGPGLVAEGVTDVTIYTYTSQGFLSTVTDPNGLVTTVITRNAQGQPTVVEQPDKSRWTFSYDVLGRLVTSGFAGPGQTPLSSSFTYNLSNQVTGYTNTRNETWRFTYNAAQRLTVATAPSGDTAAFTYDPAGNIARVDYSDGASPATFWQETEFDGLSRILRTIGAMGQEWEFAHDKEDNLTAETDPLSYSTTSSYDPLNRLINVIDRQSFSTEMAYNPADQVTVFTDPRTIATDFTYNGFGEVVVETSADGGTTSYAYDRRGLVTSMTDGRGVTTGYGYDNGGRLTLIDYPSGGIPDIAFTWDQAYLGVPVDSNKGKVGRINDGVIRMDFGHEVLAAGPRVTMTASYPGSRSYTVVEDTDFEGNVLRTRYPSGREVLVDVDDVNRTHRIRLVDGATTTVLLDNIVWAPNGPMLSALYGDGFTQTRSYDLSYRLTGIIDSNGTTTRRSLTYGYEARDNLTSVTDALVPASSETFGYTPREALSAATGPYGNLAFTYDGVGNRLTSVTGASTDSYSYLLGSNRLASVSLGGGGSRGLAYDGSGNVITDTRSGTIYAYGYNAANRLSALSVGGTPAATYIYDAMGRQVIRTLAGSGVTIHSVFDSQGRRIAEYNEATGALIREYVWMGQDPIAVIEGGVVYLVRADHIGRPAFATDLSGAVVWSASYLPFSGVHVSSGPLPNMRFPGQWFQAESSLHQNWMRDYDPTLGRYLQPDPLGLVDGASLYGYARQNPVRYTDETGGQIAEVIRGGLAATVEWGAPAAGGAIAGAIGIILYPSPLGDGTLPQSYNPSTSSGLMCTSESPTGTSIVTQSEDSDGTKTWDGIGHKPKNQSTGAFKGAKKDKHEKPRPGRSSEKKKQKKDWKPQK